MKKMIKLILSATILSSTIVPHYNVINIKASEVSQSSDFTIDENGKITDYTGASEIVTVPEGVTSMGYYSKGGVARSHLNTIFKDHVSTKVKVKSVTLPNSLIVLNQWGFAYLDEMESIVLGNKVEKIEDFVFEGCFSLKNINFPETLKEIGKSVFQETALSEITLPNSIEMIDEEAFVGCPFLEKVHLPVNKNYKKINRGILAYCTSLKEVYIPKNVEIIDEYAFAYCTSLQELEIPSSVIEIGYNAFEGCENLTLTVYPNSTGYHHAVENEIPYVLKCDKDSLQNLIDEKRAKFDENLYTTSSYQTYANFLSEKEKLIDDENVTDQQLIDAYGEILDAEKSLALRATTVEDLKNTVDFYEEDLEKIEWKLLIEYVNEFKKLLEEGKKAISDYSDLTQKDIDDLSIKIQNDYVVLETKQRGSYRTLNSIIYTYDSTDSSLYTEASWDIYTNYIEQARQIVEDKGGYSTQEDIDTLKSNIQNAIDNLVEVADTTSLQNKIDEVKQLESSYTTSSWTLYKEIIIDSEELIEEGRLSQEQVDNQIQKLEDEKSVLVLRANTENLKNKLEEIKLLESNYTTSSWSVYKATLDEAEMMINDNSDVSQAQADVKLEELTQKQDVLVERADMSQLESAYNGIYGTANDFTISSWNEFKPILDDVKAMLEDNSDVSQAQADEMKIELEEKISLLVPRGEVHLLYQKVEECTSLDSSKYTVSSWNALQQVIDEANIMINDNSDITQEQINSKILELQNAMDQLITFGELQQQLIDLVNDTTLVQDEYTPNSWANYLEMLNIGKEMAVKENASEDEIQKAYDDLTSSIENLVKKADKSSLQTFIDEVKNTDSSLYTEYSFNKFNEVLINSQKIVEDENASQQEVDEIKDKLQEAHSNLVSKELKDKLDDLIKKAEQVNRENYFTSSNEKLAEVLASVKEQNNDEASNDKLKELTTLLQQTLDEMIKIGDKAALNELLEIVKELKQDDYTLASFEQCTNAIKEAELIVETKEVTQEQVDEAYSKLNGAKENLIKFVPADKEALKQAILDAQNAIVDAESKYTIASEEAVKEMIASAEAMNSEREVSQQQVDEMVIALKEALTNLDPLGDYVSLNTLIEKANQIARDKGLYTTSSYEPFVEVLKETQKFYEENKRENAESIKEKYDCLDQSINDLTKRADVSKLRKTVKDILETETNYTISSWNEYKVVLEEAKVMYSDNSNVSQEQANAKLKEVIDKQVLLVLKGNRSKLYEVIRNADKILSDYAKYTDESVKTLRSVYDEAMKFNSDDANQEQVDEMIAKLNAAIDGIVLKTNKTELQKAIAKANNVDQYAYIKDSYNSINYWKKEADKVLTDEKATQEMIDTVTNKLNWIVDNAIYKPFNFKDVKKEAWYYKVVRDVYYRGIMLGTSDDLFSPNAYISRGMVATVLYRMAGSPNIKYKAKFTDVKDGLWYSQAITWASQNNIVSGYKDGRFGANDLITREDLVVMLRNYAQRSGINVNVKKDLSSFKDYKAVTAYAKTSVEWAVANGLMGGDALLKPTGKATRAESAKMFLQLFNMMKK